MKARYPGKVLKKESLAKFVEEKIFTLVGFKTKSNERRYFPMVKLNLYVRLKHALFIRFDESTLPQMTLFTEVDIEKNMKMFQYYANRLRKVS